MESKEECRGRPGQFFSCLRTPSVHRDGLPYCWQHDPERLRRIASERWEKRKAEIAAMEAKFDAQIERRKLEEAADVRGLTDGELRLIARMGGLRKMINQLAKKEHL